MEPLFSTKRTGLHAADATKTVRRWLHSHTAGHGRTRNGACPSLDTTIVTLAARAKLRSLREPQVSSGPEGRCGGGI